MPEATMPDDIRAIIVDDEAPARRRLRSLLAREVDVVVVAECSNGPTAIDAIAELRPDLLFLDVQMPEMDGFEVLRAAGADAVTAVVFVTAYDSYAIQAFDAQALDYLLKPFANARFRETLERVRRRIAREDDHTFRAKIEALLGGGEKSSVETRPDRIAVRTGGRVLFVNADDIDWIEGAGNYVRIHAGQSEHIVRDTLKAIAERLGPRFIRIHHSRIVNADRIRELRPWSHGEHIVVLRDGTRIRSSRGHGESLRRLISGPERRPATGR
jgi:two-component system LytT family response regulator